MDEDSSVPLSTEAESAAALPSPNRVLLNLGFDPREVYRLGSWFLVAEAAIQPAGTEQSFAPGKAQDGGRRPTVLASPLSPNAILFPRSTGRQKRSEGVYHHEAHDHRGDFPNCKVNKCGSVLFSVPVNVSAGELTHPNWSCVEPDASDLHAEIERRLRS